MRSTFRFLWPAGAIALLALTPRVSLAGGDGRPGSVNPHKPAGLDQLVAIQPGFWKISRLMSGLQSSSGLEVSRGESVPDDSGFFASRSIPLKILMNQLRLLMSDQNWSYHWATKSVPGSATRYVFSRVQLTPAEQQAAAIQRAHARIDRIIDALPEIEKGANPDVDGDPDLGVLLGSEAVQSQYAFLSELPPSEIDNLLAGNQLDLRVARLSPSDQELVMKANGHMGPMTMTDNLTGAKSIIFDPRDILTQGRVEIKGGHAGPGGEPSLKFLISSQLEGGAASGGEILYRHLGNLHGIEQFRAQHEIQDQQPYDEDLMRLIPGARPVTIDAAMPLKKDEPPFAAYLRSYAKQTGLTLLAYWPKDAAEPDRRMAQSITQQPAAEVLDSLCKSYRCQWVQDQQVIRIRYPASPKSETKDGAKIAADQRQSVTPEARGTGDEAPYLPRASGSRRRALKTSAPVIRPQRNGWRTGNPTERPRRERDRI